MAENTSWVCTSACCRGHGWDLTCSLVGEGVGHNKEQSC